MKITVMILGFGATAAAWRAVAAGRGNPWAVMGTSIGAAGLAALVAGGIRLSPRVHPAAAAVVGAGAGALLFGATVAFAALARSWEAFRSRYEAILARRSDVSLATALLVGAGVAALAEELLWRGLFQERLGRPLGRTWAAVGAWSAYVAANLPSASLPVVAGAAVGGAVWAGLALWTHGVLASVASHAVWTALMIAAAPGGSGRPRAGAP